MSNAIEPLNHIDLNDDFMDTMLWEEEQDVHYRLVGIYSPSELVFPCLRNVALRYRYPAKKNYDRRAQINFEQGNLLEEWFINRLRKSHDWDVLGTQDSIGYQEHGIYFLGRRDVRAINLPLRTTFSIEVKKAPLHYYSRESGQLETHWKYYPKTENLHQSNFYLKDDPSLVGALVYINPLLYTRWFPHHWDPQQYDYIVTRGVDVHTHLINDTLPAPERDHWGGRICEYCMYREECKLNDQL